MLDTRCLFHISFYEAACFPLSFFFFFNDTATTEIYTLSLHDALPILAGLEDQVVAVVELVDVDRHARNRRHDRRADRAVGDHAVALPAALGRDRHDGGGQVAQQLIDLVGLQDWHGTIFTAASERRARQSPQAPRPSFLLQHNVAAVAPPHPSRPYPPPP